MNVWICATCEYDSVGGDRVRAFANENDAYKFASEYVIEFVRNAFENTEDDIMLLEDYWAAKEYKQLIQHWENEVYSSSERREHPIVDVYSVGVE